MKISMKRIGALVLALVMVFGLLPVVNNTAEALDVSGTLNDSYIGLSYALGANPNTSITPWVASGNTLTGTCAGKPLGTTYYLASSNTLTITNNKEAAAKLTFDFELSGVFGSVKIDETTYTAATTGSFEKELDAGASINIVLTAKRQAAKQGINSIVIAITNLALKVENAGPVTTTFEAPAYGSYTVAYGNQTVSLTPGTASQAITNETDVDYTLTATPGTGYKFVGWYDSVGGKYLGTAPVYVGTFEKATTVKAVIVPENTAVFNVSSKVGDKKVEMYFSDLNEAVAYAQSNNLTQVTLHQDGILGAGTYTIPAGITLLIPKDTDYSVTGTDDMGIAPEYGTEVVAPYAYRVLTMAEGANLIVNGVLDIEAKHTTLQGSGSARPYGGRVCGPYGAIYMNPNSNITVNSGANLYAWGYVYGDGTVTANSGASIYEIMQVTDFPGGGNLSNFVDSDPTYDFDGDGNPTNDYIKTFPFSQYYVQNIEVALTLNTGAREYVFFSMTAAETSRGLSVQFIGENGMFNPAGGTIVKKYDPATDRLIVTVDGNATMSGITLDMTGTPYGDAMIPVIGTSKVDSATFILTLNSNITINIISGTTTVKQDLHLLPGVEISIAKDATLIIDQRTYAQGEYDNLTISGTGGYNVYVWDLENWGNYVFSNKKLVALSYSPTSGRVKRTEASLKDVVIDVNGSVICNGYIYSTVTADPDTWEILSGGGAIISSGKTGQIVMQNGCGIEDLVYCLDGSSSADNAIFIDSAWLQNGDGSYLQTWCGECFYEPCDTCWGDRATMLDCDACGGTGLAEKTCSHMGVTFNYCEGHDCWYTEGHKDSTVEVTWIINGNGGPEEYTICSIPSYKGSTPTKPANGCTSYTFAGWATTVNGEVLTQLPIVEADVTYFAIFTESVVHMGDNDKDHYCDGCDMDPTECVDENQDHFCDFVGCQAELSVCIDENYDHVCDYSNCGEEVSSCEDLDEDHYCDYSGCAAELSSCEDADADHYCDYEGCKELTSDCEDANNDHFCDHEGCKAQLSACEDDDKDHVCDYSGCKVTVSVCEDFNYDHLCDYAGCQTQMSDCADIDEDHVCDYEGCQAQTSDCDDADEDHYCDYVGCGEELSTCIDGDDKDHNCDYDGCQAESVDGGHHGGTAYCNAQMICVECGDSYGSLNGSNHAYSDSTYYGDITASTHTVYYSCCDGVKVTEGHEYVSGICGCNAKQSFYVTWNVDGTAYEETYYYGDIPTFKGNTDKANDGCTVYTFTGWDEDVVAVTGHVTYVAIYTESVVHVGDNDYDHFCDICDQELSSCEDLDEDHICDYSGCQAPLSSCEDLDEDHNCDYSGCQATLSSCEDVNEDHFCDYVGCQAELSSCEDLDEDHFCDYAGCGEQTSSCEDLDEDHYCDYSACGGKLSNCADTEGDGDHECDYTGCDEILNNCYGGEADCLNQAECEECTQPYGALKDHGFAGWEHVDNGDNHTVWCDFCWDYSYTEDHKFVNADHTCDCGAVEAFTVTFMDGNTVFAQIDVPYNGALNIYGMPIPEAPAAGYVWNGWYDAEGNKLVIGMNVTSDLTFYADWKLDSITVTWIVDGVTTTETYEYGATPSFKGNTDKAADGCTVYTFAGWDKDIVAVTGDVTYTATYTEGTSHIGEVAYTNNGDGTHNGIYECCNADFVTNEPHDYTYDTRNHKCECGAVEEFKLTVVYGPNGEHTYEAMVPYWTPMADLDEINNIPWTIYVNDATHLGHYDLTDFCWDMDGNGELDRDHYFTESSMPAHDLYVEVRYEFTGFVHDGNGWQVMDYGWMPKNEAVVFTMSDLYENGSEDELEGVYMADANGYRIENALGRYYYLGEWINGITYEPNAEDIAYYENKGQTFIDKEKTWYYFGADGKLQFDYTGLVGDSYVINGQAAWHVGLVEIDGEYYYFKGDEVNGGNKMVSGGDFYLNRNNSDFNMVVGGIYTFDNDGKMQWQFHGIVESELFEGKRHYIGGRLTPGLGLVDLITVATGEVRYFYVDSYGQLILDAEYYIGANNFGLAKGIYYFDAEGFMVIPEPEPGKEGLHFEDGKWYYYVDGAKAYCAGLIEIDGNWVYVRSDGSLATGVYYVTNTNDHPTIASGTKCTFDDNGVLIDPVINMQILAEGSASSNGGFNWEEDHAALIFTPSTSGKLIIEVSNIVLDVDYENVGFVVDVYAENYGWLGENFVLDGSMEYNVPADIGRCIVYIFPAYEAGDYCEPASGTYDYKISFGNDGSPKNGIFDGYYYVDGHIAYAAGLIEIDGIYYYVRSNGQIVTDCQYWITNVNDTGYEPGLYEFDVDGWMREIYVETFTGIRDGYFYMDDEIAYNAGLMNYNGGYIYVRSNGQLATGKYWITNHNGLLPEGFYDFGEDGFYYPSLPEGALLVKDVVKNTETDGFGSSMGAAEAIIPQEDGILYIQVTDITYVEEVLNDKGFCVSVESSDYWATQLSAQAVGPQTVSIPVKAGVDYALFVNPADIDGETGSVVNGTITYKIWSTVDFELEEIRVGQ